MQTKTGNFGKNSAKLFVVAIALFVFLAFPAFSPAGTFFKSQVTNTTSSVTEFDYVKDSLGRDHLVYVSGEYVYYKGPYGKDILVNSGSSPAIAVGPDGKPQIALYHLGYVQHAVLGENGNFYVVNVATGSSPDIAVDGNGKAHVIFFKDYYGDKYQDIVYFSNVGGAFAYVRDWNGWYYYDNWGRSGNYYNQGGVPSISISGSTVFVSLHLKWIQSGGGWNDWGTRIHVWRSSDNSEISTDDWYKGTYGLSKNSLATSSTANFVTFNGPSGIQFAEVSGTWAENVLGAGSSPSLAISAEATPSFAFVDGSDVKYSEVSTEIVPVSVGNVFVTTTVDSGSSPILAETANGAFIYYLKSGEVWKATDTDSTEPLAGETGLSSSYSDGETTWVSASAKAYAGFTDSESGISSCEYMALETTWSSAVWNSTESFCQSRVDLAEKMKFKATNGAGLSNESAWIYYEIDSRAPVFGSFISPNSNALYRDGDFVSVVLPVSDEDSGLASCEYSILDGSTEIQSGTLAYSDGNCIGTFALASEGFTGTLALRVFAYDNVGNKGYSEIGIEADNSAPSLPYVVITSNNGNSKNFAKPGDNVTLRVIPSENLGSFYAEIAGREAATWTANEIVSTIIVEENQTVYYATVQMDKNDSEGKVIFNIAYSDVAGNAGANKTSTTDGTSVKFDKTAPEMEVLSIESDNEGNSSFSRPGNLVYVRGEGLSEEYVVESFTIAGRQTLEEESVEPLDLSGEILMESEDPIGIVPFEIVLSDIAGNSATFTEANTTTRSTEVFSAETADDAPEEEYYFVYHDNRPNRVGVKKTYCDPELNVNSADNDNGPECWNDGRIWGFDAFNSIQSAVDGVYDGGQVYVLDSEHYDEAVVLSRPVSIYGKYGLGDVSAQDVEESKRTTANSLTFDSGEIYTEHISAPLVIVTGNGQILDGYDSVQEKGTFKLLEGKWTIDTLFSFYKELSFEGAGIGNSTIVLDGETLSVYSSGTSVSGVSFVSSELEESSGYAIRVYGPNFTLEDSSIEGFPSGIYAQNAEGYDKLTISGSEITGTYSFGKNGYGIWANADSLSVVDTEISDFVEAVYHYTEGDGEGEPTTLTYYEEYPSSTELSGVVASISEYSVNRNSYGFKLYSDSVEIVDSRVSGFRHGIYSNRGTTTITGSNATFEWGGYYGCYGTFGIRTYGQTATMSGIIVDGYKDAVDSDAETLTIEDFDLFGKPENAEDYCYPGKGIELYSRSSSIVRNGKIANFDYGIIMYGCGQECSLEISAQNEPEKVSSAKVNEESDYENTAVTIENVEITGGDWDYYDSLSAHGSDNDNSDESRYYDSEYGIRAYGQNNLTISGCTVERFKHGLYISGGKGLNVHGNTITENGGRNDDRSGIDLLSVESGRVHDNDIYGNNYGIYSESSNAVVELNRIYDNYEMDADASGKAANMTRNWWGTPAFEEILERVSGNVDFSFWCLDSSCTSFAEPIVLSEENATLLRLSERSAPARGSGTIVSTISNEWYSQNVGFRFAKDGVFYKVTSNGIYSIDEETGAETWLRSLIRPAGYDDANPYSLAVDPESGIVYVTLHTRGSGLQSMNKFATLDLETGVLTYIADIYVQYGGYESIAFDSEGTLYGISNYNLYTINTSTGQGTIVSTIGNNLGAKNGYSTYYYTYGMDFAPDGTLYASGYNTNNHVWGIYTIDKETGQVAWIAETGTENGYAGSYCYELAFSPDGRLYCYNYGGNSGPTLTQVKLSDGKISTFQYALGFGKSYGYLLNWLGIVGSVSGSETDLGLLRASRFTPTGLPENHLALGSLALGISGETLTFDPSLEMSIWIGTAFNGGTYSVYRSETGTGNWTQEGLIDKTCTVINGYCKFDTEKASYFAVTHYTAPVNPASEGSAPITCRSDFSLTAPAEIAVDGKYAEIPVTFSVTGTCPSYGQIFAISAPEGWLATIGSSNGLIRKGEEVVLVARVQMSEGSEGTVAVKAIVGGKEYSTETLVKSRVVESETARQSSQEQPVVTTTVAPVVTTTVAPEPQESQGIQTGFFAGFLTGLQNLWNWLSGLFGGQ